MNNDATIFKYKFFLIILMLNYCFVTLSPWPFVLATVLLTLLSAWLIVHASHSEKSGVKLAIVFVLASLVGLLFMSCLSFLIGFVELIIAYVIYRNNLIILFYR